MRIIPATSDLSLNEILSQLDNAAFFAANGLHITKGDGGSKTVEADCQFCGAEKHLNLNPKKGLWQCYKCGESGNAVSFYAKTHGCTNGDAVNAIKTYLGLAPADNAPMVKKPVATPQGGADAAEHSDTPKSGASTAHTGAHTPDITVPDVYTRLVALLSLLPQHRKSLKEKRGFTDNTIDRLQFRSGGKHLPKIVNELRREFADAILSESKLLVEANGSLICNEQLTYDNVLIPYLDERGKVYRIRAHKYGFEDLPAQVYCRALLADKPERIVITEGEFKAAALWQCGIPAIAVPGISSFGDKNFDRLVELLREFEVKQIVIAFDNEVKDNPDYPNYKQQPEERYDTQYWAYLMAKELSNPKRCNFIARVGLIPDEWRINGKSDWDGALAIGKTKAELVAVINAAIPPTEYLDSLSEEARRIVWRKKEWHYEKHRIPIIREHNHYEGVKKRGETGEVLQSHSISNFVINIIKTRYTSEGVKRIVKLTNEFGDVSVPFELDPAEMAGLNEFKKFCFAKGNYVFEGSSNDLNQIWRFEFLRHPGEFVDSPDTVGRMSDGSWLFSNLLIKKGRIYRPDNDGVFWVNGSGIQPKDLSGDDGNKSGANSIPFLSENPIDIEDIAHKMRECIGGYEAYAAIGWAIASIFSEDIFAKYKCFPFIYPHGMKGSGKTSLMRWIMNFFGLDTEGFNLPESSQVFIVRTLSYFSSLGIWFDEFRNGDRKILEKQGYLRSAYNRQGTGKGIKKSFGTMSYKVVGTLAISGEELPKDGGLFSRCLPMQISTYKRNRKWYDWLNLNSVDFSSLTRELILNYDEYATKILSTVESLKWALVKGGIIDRTAENWAIVAGAFFTVVEQDAEFIRWIQKTAMEWQQAEKHEEALNQFWTEMNVMIAQEELDTRHLQVQQNAEGQDVLYVWLSGAYDIWSSHFKKKTGREVFDFNTILKYLQQEPYYLPLEGDKNKIYFRHGKETQRRRAHAVLIEKAPDEVKELSQVIKDKGNYSAEQPGF